MMIIRRILGVLLILAAVGGLIFSIAALVGIWQVEPNLTTSLQTTITLLSDTLETTSQGLVVTNAALQTSVDTIGNLQSTLETTAKVIQSTNPMVDDIAALMSDKLPETIAATQQSLNTARDSAQVIDALLQSLSSLPLIGASIGYSPEVPLSEALGEVAASLTELPNSFASMEENLRTTQSNLQTFEADMTVMATSIGQIQQSVAQYEQVVTGYQNSINQVQSQLETLSASLPQIVRGLVLGLTAFLVWMAIAQLGLFTQGWELLTERPRRERAEEIHEEQPVVVVTEPAGDKDDLKEEAQEPIDRLDEKTDD